MPPPPVAPILPHDDLPAPDVQPLVAGASGGEPLPLPLEDLASAEPAEMDPLSVSEEDVSHVARAIFRVGPAAMPSLVAIPALYVVYYVVRMSFLLGIEPGAAMDTMYDAVVAMLEVPKLGWPTLERCFDLPLRGLYLAGRSVLRASQLCGQPTSLPDELFDIINPDGGKQWVSRRLRLRTELYLFPAAQKEPGDLTASELSNIRDTLSTTVGRASALSLGCKIVGGLDDSGNYASVAHVHFDWQHTSQAGTKAAQAVRKLSKGLLKAPHGALCKVADFPLDPVTRPSASRTPGARLNASGKRQRQPSGADACADDAGALSATAPPGKRVFLGLGANVHVEHPFLTGFCRSRSLASASSPAVWGLERAHPDSGSSGCACSRPTQGGCASLLQGG